MRTKEDKRLDLATKKAWDDNWKNVDTGQILEIFKYPRVQKQIEIFKCYLPKNKKILESGCGLGPYLIYFRELNYDIIGIDYNHAPLAKISDYKPGTPLVCADVSNIPFSDSSFGACLSLGVIEHFSGGPEPAIKETYRVLENGGYFIISVPRLSIFHRLKVPLKYFKKSAWLRKMFKKAPPNHYWEQYFKISELVDVIKRNNFEIIKIFPVDQEHSLVVFSNMFRDRNSYDGANSLGILLANFFQKYIPWSTAAAMIIICRKIK